MGAQFAGSVASCGVPPEGLWVATVGLNGLTVGTLTVLDTGVTVLATSSPNAIPLVPGDIVSLTAPEEPDVAIGRVRITFTGEL
jgi:hypothetical protein